MISIRGGMIVGCALWLLVLTLTTSTTVAAGTDRPFRLAPGNGPTFRLRFDNPRGEGDLISAKLVLSYNTATPGGMNPTPGLDSFYSKLVCSGLSQTDCDTNVTDLATREFGDFDLSRNPIGKNALGIKTVDAVKIDYTAINVNGSAVTVSGGIAIPKIDSSALKGLILYFHGTTVQRNNVPSNFTATNNVSTYTDGILMAAVWASQGYIVVMPDYIGLGDDTADVHPYVVYPRVDARSGLAMLKAARIYLKDSYGVDGQLPLFVTGYSEGGAYALDAAHVLADDPDYASALAVTLEEAAPMSGFFDLSGTGDSYLFDNISSTNNPWFSLDPITSALSKPYLSAYLALSFANYSRVAAADILASKFFNCPSNVQACGASHDLFGLYFTAPQSSGYDLTVLLNADSQATQTKWSTTSNSVAPLLTMTYADALMKRDKGNPLYRQLLSADTYRFIPDFPVDLVSLKEDSVVTRKNSDVAFAYFENKRPDGPYREQLVDNSDFLVKSFFSTGPIDHTSELPFLTVLILNQFNMIP